MQSKAKHRAVTARKYLQYESECPTPFGFFPHYPHGTAFRQLWNEIVTKAYYIYAIVLEY